MADPARINSPSRETSGADDVVFQEAIDVLRGGNKARARELLTGLIKNDQNNAEYWVWLSGTMETPKERIYCLQTAFKLDPENAAAKRGLILLGALPADETIQPFQMKGPRAWEEKLLLAHEKPKLKGWAAVRASPVFRLGIVILIIGAIASGIGFGFVIPAMNERSLHTPTNTPGASPTYTLTVTVVGGRPQTQIAGTPNSPLADLLDTPYTPTPLYVTVERAPETSDYLVQFNRAYQLGDWDTAIEALLKVVEVNPDLATAYYYLGESYRFKSDVGRAQQYYNEAITKNETFGAAYVGVARSRLLSDPNANVLPLLDQAIELDPNFGDAYLERAHVKIRDNDIPGAVLDLGEANKILGDSPLIYYYLAEARMKEGAFDLALETAKRANELDITHLPTYLLLGRINIELGDYDEAVKYFDFYVQYAPKDAAAYFEIGKFQFELGKYEESVQAMTEVIRLDRNRREAYLYRFLANVELGNGPAADEDLDTVMGSYPDLFEANLALVRTHLLNDRKGSALVDLEKTLELAQTNQQKALAYYWAAIVHETRDELEEAAKYWKLLLELPEESMTEEMRQTAEEHLSKIGPAGPTSTPTRTPTPTRKPTSTRTPTPTKTPKP